MRKTNQILIALFASAALSTQAFAEQEEQTFDLEVAEIDSLVLTNIEEEAEINANEVHQEATVGRAGLQGNCVDPIFGFE